jgi:adenosine deaminase
LTEECRVLAERFGFSAGELARLMLNGAEAAFLDAENKRALIERMRAGFAALGVTPA